jgi:hypothetical protein
MRTRFLLLSVMFGGALYGAPADPAAILAAGYQSLPPVVAPGQIITFFIHGIGSNLTGPIRASTIPLPLSLGGISAILQDFARNPAVPILAVEPISTCGTPPTPGCGLFTAITVQIPYEIHYVDPNVNCGGCLAFGGNLRFVENGITVAIDVGGIVDRIHLVRSCDLMLAKRDLFSCSPILAHANGDLVNDSNRAKAGEEVVLYAVGLGPMGIGTGQPVPVPPLNSARFTVSFDFRPDALVSRPPLNSVKPEFAGLTPGFQGLYQINVVIPAVPPGTPPCTPGGVVTNPGVGTNLTINVGGPTSFDGIGICVAPGP